MTRGWLGLGLLAVAAACGAQDGQRAESAAQSSDPAVEITRMLHASAEAWNRGDLDGFLDDYLDTVETTFVGASGVVRGVDEIRRGYRSSYWSDGAPREALSFEGLEVRPLGEDHALALGRYVLHDEPADSMVATGRFSLVLRRVEDRGWKIIHDHSSAGS